MNFTHEEKEILFRMALIETNISGSEKRNGIENYAERVSKSTQIMYNLFCYKNGVTCSIDRDCLIFMMGIIKNKVKEIAIEIGDDKESPVFILRNFAEKLVLYTHLFEKLNDEIIKLDGKERVNKGKKVK